MQADGPSIMGPSPEWFLRREGVIITNDGPLADFLSLHVVENPPLVGTKIMSTQLLRPRGRAVGRTNSRRAAAGLVHHVCPGLVVLQRADDVSCSDMFSTTTARTTMTALSWYCSNSEKSRLRTPPSSPGTGLCSSPGTGLCSSPRDGLPPPSARMRERCPGTGAHAFGVEEDICSIHVSC